MDDFDADALFAEMMADTDEIEEMDDDALLKKLMAEESSFLGGDDDLQGQIAAQNLAKTVEENKRRVAEAKAAYVVG